MPELPEVETVCRGLVPVLEGRRIARLTLRRKDLRIPFPKDLKARAEGRKIERIVGGQIFQMPDGERFDRVVLATGAGQLPSFVGPRGAPLEHGLVEMTPVKGQMLALAPVAGGRNHDSR